MQTTKTILSRFMSYVRRERISFNFHSKSRGIVHGRLRNHKEAVDSYKVFKKLVKSISLSSSSFFFKRYMDFRIPSGITFYGKRFR
ncbi:hypothetical protein [Flagellimonas sp.]|uniref:hypothetical protein n=1 Tax=Flagellimonas sp. TaxID=2058762 RepID=UPI003B521B91